MNIQKFLTILMVKQAQHAKMMYKNRFALSEEVLQTIEFDIVDDILNFVGVAEDNSLEVESEDPYSMCRDGWYDEILDIETREDAQKWVQNAILFAKLYKECDRDMKKYTQKYPIGFPQPPYQKIGK